ncbi:hypothetical protein [Candidatus Epulonipiscium viviparus]|uniref:hypothetical protein n=1 Tax=Candidatus Epulonipiscium viviparus TaxID=420336 RepID=UPI0027380AF6|nr:hypothetical protein [Candidatus Epulopiscium viviparus]
MFKKFLPLAICAFAFTGCTQTELTELADFQSAIKPTDSINYNATGTIEIFLGSDIPLSINILQEGSVNQLTADSEIFTDITLDLDQYYEAQLSRLEKSLVSAKSDTAAIESEIKSLKEEKAANAELFNNLTQSYIMYTIDNVNYYSTNFFSNFLSLTDDSFVFDDDSFAADFVSIPLPDLTADQAALSALQIADINALILDGISLDDSLTIHENSLSFSLDQSQTIDFVFQLLDNIFNNIDSLTAMAGSDFIPVDFESIKEEYESAKSSYLALLSFLLDASMNYEYAVADDVHTSTFDFTSIINGFNMGLKLNFTCDTTLIDSFEIDFDLPSMTIDDFKNAIEASPDF